MSEDKQLKIPNIGDSDSIELLQWLKKEGDSFKAGEELCDLVTDKAAFCLEAPYDGILKQIIVSDKSVVSVGQAVAMVSPEPGN